MTRSRAEWFDKANALSEAVGGSLDPKSIAVLLAVAEHETRCGDAWPGEHNWGATTLRRLHPDELAVIRAASIAPTVGAGHLDVEAKARAALAEAVAAGTIPDPGPSVALHCDSEPIRGVYFIFFAAFPTDVAGARYFAGFFKTAAEHAAIASGDPYQMAAAMYSAGYYTGFHVKTGRYETRDGRWVLLGSGEQSTGPVKMGAELNVADYASSLARLLPGIVTALAGWSPGAEPPAVTEPASGEPDLGTTEGVQAALNQLGAAPPLVVDGVAGPKTKTAILAFQFAHHLAADGIVGPKTIQAIRDALVGAVANG